jgi:fermentation-respiration switch protein FrsA (DUF1100 family)
MLPWWLRAFVTVTAVVAVLVGLLWAVQRRLVFQPDSAAVPPAAQLLPGGRDVELRTADGLELDAWYVPAPAGSCRATVLVAPGNAGNRWGRAPLARELVDRGFGVLLVDYRGYGGNPGSPTEAGLAADIAAGYHFLTVEQGLTDRELVYFGESLGAAVVTAFAVAHAPAALVLRSPFTSLAAVAQRQFWFLPVRMLLRDRFEVQSTIGAIKAPVTVIYGTDDSIVPAEQSLAVAAAAGSPAVVAVEGADHNDGALVTGPLVINAVVSAARESGCLSR